MPENWWHEMVQSNGVMYTIIAVHCVMHEREGLVCLFTTALSNRVSAYNDNELSRGDVTRRPFWLYYAVKWFVGLTYETLWRIAYEEGESLGTIESFIGDKYPGGIEAFANKYCYINWQDISMYKRFNEFIANELHALSWRYHTSGLSHMTEWGIDVYIREEWPFRITVRGLVSPTTDVRHIANHRDVNRGWVSPHEWYKCADLMRLYEVPSVSAWDTLEYKPDAVAIRMKEYLHGIGSSLRLDATAIRIYFENVQRIKRDMLAKAGGQISRM